MQNILEDGLEEQTSQEGTKPSIYVVLCPEKSSFNASFSLTRRLKELGYRIVYTGPAHYREYIKAQGFGYKAFGAESTASSRPNEQKRPVLILKQWRERRARILHSDRFWSEILSQAEALLRLEKPVLILLNPLIQNESLPAIRCGIPIITLNTTLASTFDFSMPPVFSDFQPQWPVSVKQRLRYLTAWLRCICPIWYQRFLSDKIMRARYGLLPRRSLTATARRLGARVRWGEYGPCLDVPELVLAPEALDFPQFGRRRQRTYVGACVDVLREEGTYNWGAIDKTKPLIYCSLGTYSAAYKHARRLFYSVTAALKCRGDVEVIIQIGTTDEAGDFGELPSHIHLVEHVPQLEILKHADVFITHGGFSSIREAIYFGVPMIVFPCWLDQPGNAARVLHHGIGLKGNIASVDVEAMTSLLNEIREPRYKQAVMAMRSVFQEQQSCRAGVDFVREFLKADFRL